MTQLQVGDKVFLESHTYSRGSSVVISFVQDLERDCVVLENGEKYHRNSIDSNKYYSSGNRAFWATH
jgi:signal peptidase I